jgi:hypothetical protein
VAKSKLEQLALPAVALTAFTPASDVARNVFGCEIVAIVPLNAFPDLQYCM